MHEYDLPRKNNDTLLEQQEFLKKRWKLIAKFWVIVGAHDEFCEEKEPTGEVTPHAVLRTYMDILRRSVPNEALTADSETHMEDLDEQMLLSAGQGAEIAEVLEKYEGASELVVEVDRAIEQVQKSLLAQAELKSEKEELESATKTVTKDVESK